MANELTNTSDKIPAISNGPFEATPTGLRVEDGEIPYELWEAYGHGLKRVEGAIQWVIGDWLNYGEHAYGEKYSQALAMWPETEYDAVRDYHYVAANVESAVRTAKLTWSHHRQVAKLNASDQGRLLVEAEQNGWSVRALKQAIKDKERIEQAKKGENIPDDERNRVFTADIADVTDIGQVDAIITDPPYPREFLHTWSELGAFARRVLKPGGLVVAMTGQYHLPEVLERLGEHLDYQWTLSCLLPGPSGSAIKAGVANIGWKPILVYRNGGEPVNIGYDVFENEAPDKSAHDWGQGVSGYQWQVEKLTQPGDVVCDPFVGGGTTGIAAVTLNRRFVGFDIDEQQTNIAKARINEALQEVGE